MNNTPNYRKRTDTVFVLMTFCVFAMSVLLVLALSASAYQNMNEISGAGRDEHVALSYVRTRIRSTDTASSIVAGYFDGVSALFLEETFGGDVFVTVIYHYNGWVHELFHERGSSLSPAQGTPIIQAGSLRFETLSHGLIRATAGDRDMLIFPRSAAGAESEGF